MRQLIIDRFEGKFAICEDGEQKYFAIDIAELPKEAKAGAVLEIDREGNLRLNEAETQARRQRILEKKKRAFQDK